VPAAGASALVGGSSAAGGITQIAAQVPAEIPAVASPSFFAVSVSDLDAAESWYRRILGLETVRAVQSRDDRSRAVVMRRGDLVVELVHFDGSRSPRTDPGVEHPFQIEGLVKAGVFVADAAQWHAYLQGAHVDTDADVVTDETLAVRTFVFRDLEGNRIQVFEGCEQGC
jgi:catechol 2,3-dioxygenase-like lactoylglutathione lyase family enzyme